IADFSIRKVKLLAGSPGTPGKQDGTGRAALFNRPTGIALTKDGKTLLVADTNNNRIRLISRDGVVTTLTGDPGVTCSTGQGSITRRGLRPNGAGDGEMVFDGPRSVDSDTSGNIYTTDNNGAKVISRPISDTRQGMPLAQCNGSFNRAVSVA